MIQQRGLNGKNGSTIVVCNDFFTDYRTGDSKSRIAALKALMGGKISFVLNDIALGYISLKVGNRDIVKRLEELKSDRVYSEEDLKKEILEKDWIKDKIMAWKRYVIEGMATWSLQRVPMWPPFKNPYLR